MTSQQSCVSEIKTLWKMWMVIRIPSQKAIFVMWTNECKHDGFLLVHGASSAEDLNPHLFVSRKSNSLTKSLLTFRKSTPCHWNNSRKPPLLTIEMQASDTGILNTWSHQHSKFASAQKDFYAQRRAGCKDRAKTALHGCAKCSVRLIKEPRSLGSGEARSV